MGRNLDTWYSSNTCSTETSIVNHASLCGNIVKFWSYKSFVTVYLGEALFPTRWCYIEKLLKLDSFVELLCYLRLKSTKNNDLFAKDWDRERQLPHPLPPSCCRDPYFKYFFKNLHLDMMFQVTFFLTNSNMVMNLFLELILLLTILLIKERLC